MLPPSLRLLVNNPTRSASLQLQRRLSSKNTQPRKFADLLSWVRKTRGARPQKQSQSRRNAQSGGSVKKKGAEREMKPIPPRLKPRNNVSNARALEKQIAETVAEVLGNKKPPSPVAHGWSGDDWKSDNWGVDELRPALEDAVVTVKKPKLLESGSAGSGPRPGEKIGEHEGKYTRELKGVLTPLGRPILQDVAPLTEHRPIPTLAHKLDRVLFNPGVHWLQEPRSGVYNFTPWLQNVPDVDDFAFERLPKFVKSSKDKDLRELAKRERKTFCGSTSSLTGMLSQVYFLISGIRQPDTSSLSGPFQYMPADFTPGQRMPASVVLNYQEGVYAIDSANNGMGDADKNVLTWLGTLLEKFLTTAPEEFRRLLRDSPNPTAESGDIREACRYAKSGELVMRSQLDCHDGRLPGTGVFDLKTRAALPVRMDVMNYKQHSTYLIRTLRGEMESFEREYYDLMRSAFLKYGFQARIGNMDGILVAHHNAARIFGFRYIPLSEMDECLFGGQDRGEAVFEKCVGLLEVILEEVIRTIPGQTVRCLFETRGNKLEVYVEPEGHDESEGERRIVQMVVQSASYINGDRINSEVAVAKSGSWDLHWSIGHTSLSEKEKEYELNKARERQWRAYCLPPGVSMDEMEEIWNKLDFGSQRRLEEASEVISGDGVERGPPSGPLLPPVEKESRFDPSFFLPPTGNVVLLRKLSRKGKVDMDLMSKKAEGQPKLIWGEPEAYMDQAESDEVPSGTDEVTIEASEVAGEPLVTYVEAALADEDIRADEATG